MKPSDETDFDPVPFPRTRLPEDDGIDSPPPAPDTDEQPPEESVPSPTPTQTPQTPTPTTTQTQTSTSTQTTTQTSQTQTSQTQTTTPQTQPSGTQPSGTQPSGTQPPPPSQTSASEAASEFLQYLPNVYREDPFIGHFLLAFEEVFLDLESSVARISDYFTPQRAPKEFLPWLAKWTALSLRADLDENQQRDFIANVIQLYRWRGSKANLQRLLKIFTGGEAVITEDIDRPHYFHVALSLPKEWREKPVEFLGRKKEIAYDLVDLEKPAHTYYKLDFIYPSMQIGVRSTVGQDTVLGVRLRE